ncbi:MAG: arsenate reductase family protein [Sulfuricurvum sp.]|uniref:ArsC/Spx/MgsR family protein n=1 Tax=Sulfuricurvum sp. TaxID=2025608 RepID=UPI00262AABB1|nr:ArsC/Spx/MgsR family protein [Sulfuricurvum sp.]MDD2830197.1 arsenate reductase family protein [Sulfuricurvum sp.]MDD4949563.1 arsenate reductase family protein [Sulfuricurvum sp.]
MVKLVIFYEKPFCAANAKQKQILRSSGCTLIERNLLEHGLDAQTLRSFMGDKKISDWFNPAAPAIKNGEIFPETLDEVEAMELLISNPILIRRPLMIIGTEKLCGFDEKKVSELLERYVEAMPKINCLEKGCLEKRAE